MVSLQSIGNSAFDWVNSNLNVNLSNLHNLTSIGSGFFYYSTSHLQSITIGDVDWSNITINATNMFGSVPNNSTKTLYASDAQTVC